MKRYMFAIFLLSIFFTSGLTMTAYAAETVASGSCGETINWVLTDDGTLTLSGYGEMENNGNLANAEKDFGYYSHRTKIKSIVVEDGITSIAPYAFYNYGSYITSVSLPDSILTIGKSAFSGALKSVSSIRLPSNLQVIGDYAFQNMTSLVSITIPASVISIGLLSFENCTKLVSVVCLPEVPPTNAYDMFRGYKVLSRIMVPEGTADAYKSASGWSSYAGFITDGLPDPNGFTVLTSWADQYIYLDSDEQVNLYFIADGVNGSVSVDWYVNGELFKSFTSDNWLDNDTVIDAYYFDPGTYGTHTIYAVVHNTIGSNTESVTTPSCTIIHGQGTGSGSTDSDRFDQIDVELTEVKDAIGDVSDKVDGISDAVDQLPGQITDGMQQIQDQEKVEADSQGQDAVDQIIDVIPDESENFILALGSLVNVLSYEGTSAVITMPAMIIPAVSNLFPEIKLLEEQDIDLEYYINMLPQWLLVLCRAFFDAAIVLYCIREFLGLIGDFANGFGRVNDGLGVSFDE